MFVLGSGGLKLFCFWLEFCSFVERVVLRCFLKIRFTFYGELLGMEC